MKKQAFLKSIHLLIGLFAILSISCAQIPKEFTFWKFSSGAYCNVPLINDTVIYCGSMDKIFYAINIKTGKEIWRSKTNYIITSNAAIQNKIICFESGNKLFGLNAGTGELLWSYAASDKTPSGGQSTNYHHSSPLIENNIAYYGDEWGNLNGIDISTGKLVFQYSIKKTYKKASNYNIRTKPAIRDNIIYFGDYGANVYAVSLLDSSERWIQQLFSTAGWDASLVSDVIIMDSSVYIGGYNNQFSPLDIKTGNPRWTFSDYTFLPSTPVFFKNTLILGTTIFSNKIHCLNVSDGNVIWSTKVKGIFFVKPVIFNDSILAISSTDPFVDNVGVLYFINCNNGKIVNQIFLDNQNESSPVVKGDTLFLGCMDGMYAINYKPYLVENNTSNLDFDSSIENIDLNKNRH